MFLMRVFMFSLTGCKQEEASVVEVKKEDTNEIKTEAEETVPDNQNFLSGIPDEDIIFETLVESD